MITDKILLIYNTSNSPGHPFEIPAIWEVKNIWHKAIEVITQTGMDDYGSFFHFSSNEW